MHTPVATHLKTRAADREHQGIRGRVADHGIGKHGFERELGTGRAIVTTGGHDRDALRCRVGIEAMDLRHHGAATRVEQGVFSGSPALREDVDQMVAERVALQLQKLG